MSEEIAAIKEQEQVGDRLVALMNSRSLTAYQFAKTLGYEGPQKLYKLLQNKSKPGYETLMDVLDHYPTLRAVAVTPDEPKGPSGAQNPAYRRASHFFFSVQATQPACRDFDGCGARAETP